MTDEIAWLTLLEPSYILVNTRFERTRANWLAPGPSSMRATIRTIRRTAIIIYVVLLAVVSGCEGGWTPPEKSAQAIQASTILSNCQGDARPAPAVLQDALNTFKQSPECASRQCQGEANNLLEERDPELFCHSLEIFFHKNAGIGQSPIEQFLTWLPTSYWVLVVFVLWLFGTDLVGLGSLAARQRNVRWAFLGALSWLLAMGAFTVIWTPSLLLWLCVGLLTAASLLVLILPKIVLQARVHWIEMARIPFGLATTSLSLASLGVTLQGTGAVLVIVSAMSGLVAAAEEVRSHVLQARHEAKSRAPRRRPAALRRSHVLQARREAKSQEPSAIERRQSDLEPWLAVTAQEGLRRVSERLARLRERGLIDAQGNLLVPLPEDMRPGSSTDV